MNETADLIACYGCGVLVPNSDGPTHRYIGAAPGCWALHGEVLARAAADRRLGDPRLFILNSYAVQHPGVPGPQAIQSVAAHLIGLYAALVLVYDDRRLIGVLRQAADRSERFRWLAPPTATYRVTIGNVHSAASPAAHAAAARNMAEATWDAWQPHHSQVVAWAGEVGVRP